jgi:cytochrome b
MSENNPTSIRKIRLWDLPLRLFHWALLLCVTGAIASAELADEIAGAMDWHPRFGYAILGLLIFRLIWGFVGSEHARFTRFVRGPAAILEYLRGMKDATGPSIGHNPLGALSVLALLATLLFQAGSGLFLNDDDFAIEGPLYKHVSESVVHVLRKLHETNAGLIFALIGLHLCAILFYRFIKRENLVTPMLTGNKEIPAEAPDYDAQGGSNLLGLGVFALAAGLVWFVVTKV